MEVKVFRLLFEDEAKEIQNFVNLDDILQVVAQIASAIENGEQEIFVHDEVGLVQLHSQSDHRVDQCFQALLDLDVLIAFRLFLHVLACFVFDFFFAFLAITGQLSYIL